MRAHFLTRFSKACALLILLSSSNGFAQLPLGTKAFPGPSSVDSDLTFLDPHTDSVDLFAIAEPIHGSSNIDQTRFRITKYLIEQKGYRSIFLEWAAFFTRDFNEIIQSGNCDAPGLRNGIKRLSIVYQSEEFYDFFKWLCKRNEQNPNDRVQLYGFDVNWEYGFILYPKYLKGPIQAAGITDLDSEFDQAEKNCLAYTAKTGKEVEADPHWKNYEDGKRRDPVLHAGCNTALRAMMPKLDQNEAAWRKKLGDVAYSYAKIAVRNLQSMEDIYDSLHTLEPFYFHTLRDFYQAQNLLDQKRFNPKAKAVFLAHNYHAMKNQSVVKNIGWPSVQSSLEVLNLLRPDIQTFILGMSVYKASAIWYGDKPAMSDPKSIEVFLHPFGEPYLYIDSKNSFLSEKSTWSMFGIRELNPIEQFDALIYVDQSPASQAIPFP